MLRSKKFHYLILLAATAVFTLLLSSRPAQAADDNWTARYWNNTTLSGDPILRRSESELNHLWGDGAPNGVDTDNFSARWTRTIYLEAGSYRFTATMDDGMRVWVDDVLLIDAWYDSQLHSISADVYLDKGDHDIEVHYYEAGGQAAAQLFWSTVSGVGAVQGWQAEYFNNPSLAGQPALVRGDGQSINFDWGTATPAANVVNADQFSVRWTQSLSFTAGRYRFTTTSDDGVRLWVNNVLIIDQWRNQAETTHSAEINLPGGTVPVKLEYYDDQGAAVARLSWTRLGELTAVPPAVSSPAPSPAPMPAATGGWLGQYFNNHDLSGTPAAERVDTAVDFIWGSSSPIPNVVNADNFAVRWVGTPTFNAGRYQFLVSADGGIRLWVNDQLLIDSWMDSYMVKPYGAAMTLPGGPATVRLEFLEDKGLAEVHLSWQREGETAVSTGAAQAVSAGTAGAASSGNLTASLINARYLNVRSGPGMSFESIAYLSAWQVVELTGYRDLYADWIQVRLPDGRTGWAGGRYLSGGFPFMDLALWTG
jgi:hypothetical protein